MLDDRAHQRIIEAHFQRGCGDHDVRVRGDTSVLGRSTADNQSRIERMTDVFAHPPTLPLEVADSVVSSSPAKGSERLAA
ncbi:hypothetical protein AQ860_11335 [Burkholderia pseudomallei]|nr:hypothetical protein AQ860_11335 [Burkholderia pseudomallei]